MAYAAVLPPSGPAPAPALDPTEFRRCMRALPGTVAIVTCGADGARTGLTATAVCSLTDEPPMLLVCVNSRASAHPVIRAGGRFAVNILDDSHRHLAARFSGRGGREGEARFAGTAWLRRDGGAPLLADAVATFDCVLEAEHRHGSHSIFVGRVRDAAAREGRAPLLYLAGRFGRFADPPPLPLTAPGA